MFVFFAEYYFEIKSRKVRWAEHEAYINKIINMHKILVGKPKGKRSLGRLKNRWENNIIVTLHEMGRENLVWIIPHAGNPVDNPAKSPLLWPDVKQDWNELLTFFGKTRQYKLDKKNPLSGT